MNESSISCSGSANSTSGEIVDLQFTAAIFTINIALGLPGNFYIIWLLVKQELRNEIFFFNLAMTEIIFSFSCVSILLNLPAACFKVENTAVFFGAFLQEGRPLFQCCICVERYVAVVHPIVFLKYNQLKYRIACSTVVWILIISSASVFTRLYDIGLVFLVYRLLLAEYVVILPLKLFTCLTVLKVLKQAGPSEGRKNRKVVQKSKIKAFRIIFMVLISSLLTYIPVVLSLVLYNILDAEKFNTAWSISLCFVIIAGIVHPFIYVHRSASPPFCKRL